MAIKDRSNETSQAMHREAREMRSQGAGAAEFSARFFGPKGRLSALWTNDAEREKLVRSDLYKWLQQQLAEVRRQEAKVFERQVETLSGRITIVIPKSLHRALKDEAAQEGVSLSEIMRLKLSAPYRLITAMIAGRGAATLPGMARKGQ